MGYRNYYGNKLLKDSQNIQAVADLLHTCNIVRGNVSKNVEAQVADFFNVPYAHLLTNATCGLKSSLMAVRPCPGDVVIIPKVGFISVVNVVLSSGLIPVLLDVDSDYHLSADALSNFLQHHASPAAIFVLHLDGRSANLNKILKIAGTVPVIEDCAQSFGVKFHGKYVGTFGRFGCFSFNQNKILSSGEGGVVICSDKADYMSVVRYSSNGSGSDLYFQFDENSFFGENYTITDICSSLISYQLKKFNFIEEQLALNCKRVVSLLNKKGILFNKWHSGDVPVSIRITDKQAVKAIMETNVPYIEWQCSDLTQNPIVSKRLSPYKNKYPWNLVKDDIRSEYEQEINGISMLIPLPERNLEKLLVRLERI